MALNESKSVDRLASQLLHSDPPMALRGPANPIPEPPGLGGRHIRDSVRVRGRYLPRDSQEDCVCSLLRKERIGARFKGLASVVLALNDAAHHALAVAVLWDQRKTGTTDMHDERRQRNMNDRGM